MSTLTVNTISETTSGNGVTVDGVNLKDSQVPAAAGSSMVLIKKVEISGTPSTVTFDNSDSDVVFDTTYDNYIFYVSNVIPTDNNVMFYARLRTDGSDITSGYYGGASLYYTNTSATGTTTFDFAQHLFKVPEIHHNIDNGGVSAKITLYKPADSTECTNSTVETSYYRSNNYLYGGLGICSHNSTAKANGIVFWFSGSSTWKNTGTISMYGVKNA
tara:strand:- start:299 stop:946 length:648 start_codon:yes stop_codon:yes gene_type:complete